MEKVRLKNLLNLREGYDEMRAILELSRVISLLVILGVVFATILGRFYSLADLETGKFATIGLLPILIIIFVLYRNKLQFSGWYKGKHREKLPKKVTQSLLTVAFVLIILPPILSCFFN